MSTSVSSRAIILLRKVLSGISDAPDRPGGAGQQASPSSCRSPADRAVITCAMHLVDAFDRLRLASAESRSPRSCRALIPRSNPRSREPAVHRRGWAQRAPMGARADAATTRSRYRPRDEGTGGPAPTSTGTAARRCVGAFGAVPGEGRRRGRRASDLSPSWGEPRFMYGVHSLS